MTNKEIIREVNEGFAEGNNEKILKHVADDVTWEMPGVFHHTGKEAFEKEISNEMSDGYPTIIHKNEISEGDMVAVEGHVTCKLKNGGMLDASFFDFYRLENGKIKEMRSYVLQNKNSDYKG